MQRLNYGPFDDTIQALKVEDKYMVLTFCLDRLFSIILTREPKALAIEVGLAKQFTYNWDSAEYKCFELFLV